MYFQPLNMKPEIKQLLQHDDHANRLIGCWLAWHDGYGTIDIANVLIPDFKDGITLFLGKYGISITVASLRNKWGTQKRNKYIYTFKIHHIADDKLFTIQYHTIKSIKNATLFNKTFNHFKHMFIEYILSEE